MGRNIGENLRDLFDFQKFEGNKKLQGVIDSSLNATFGGNALSDDMLEFAAGGRETDDKVTEAGVKELRMAYCEFCKKKTPFEIYMGNRGICTECRSKQEI